MVEFNSPRLDTIFQALGDPNQAVRTQAFEQALAVGVPRRPNPEPSCAVISETVTSRRAV